MLSYRYKDDHQNQQGPFCSLCMSKFYMKQCFKLDHVFLYQENDEIVTNTLELLIEKYGGDDPFRATSPFEVAPECSNPKCKNKKKSRMIPRYVIDPPIDQTRKHRLLSGLDSTQDINKLIQRIDDLGFQWRCLCEFRTEDKLSLLRHIIAEEHLTTNCTVQETAIDHIETLVKDLRFAAIKNMAQSARNKCVEGFSSSSSVNNSYLVDDLMFTIKEIEPKTAQNGTSTNNHLGDRTADRVPSRTTRPDSRQNGSDRVPSSMSSRLTRPDSRQNGIASSSKPKPQAPAAYKPKSLFVWNPTALPLMCQQTSANGPLLKGNELISEMEVLKKRCASVDRTTLDSSTVMKLLFNQRHCHICDVPVSNLPSSLLDHVLDAGHIKRMSETGACRDEIKHWITKIEMSRR